LIEQLQTGTAPWQRSWKAGTLRRPHSAVTGTAYRGGNSLALMMSGFEDPRWMTFNQALSLGGKVAKGARGTRIAYWKFEGNEPVIGADGQPKLGANGKTEMQRVKYQRPRMFHAVVFNAEQVHGLPKLEDAAMPDQATTSAMADAVLRHSGVTVLHRQIERPYYSPGTDQIVLPARARFNDDSAYYAIAMHELAHATGHSSRLNRDLANPFGSEGYAREELRAEIASLMLGERFGLGHDPGHHAAYVNSWIEVLKRDPSEILAAARDAEGIADYIGAIAQRVELERGGEAAEPLTMVSDRRAEVGDRIVFVHSNHDFPALTGTAVDWRAGGADVDGNQLLTVRNDDGRTQAVNPLHGRLEAFEQTLNPGFESEAEQRARIGEIVPLRRALQADYSGVVVDIGSDHLTVDSGGNRLNVRTATMERVPVVGTQVVVTRSQDDNDNRTMMPLREWQALLNYGPAITPEQVKQWDASMAQAVVAARAVEPYVAKISELAMAMQEVRGRLEMVSSGGDPDGNPDPNNAIALHDVLRTVSGAAERGDYASAQGVLDNARATLGPQVAALLAEPAELARDLADATRPAPTQAERSRENSHAQSGEDAMTQRIYLAVPYKEKDQAKQAGARWDRDAKAWYAGEGADMDALAKWKPDAARVVAAQVGVEKPEHAFARALREAGLLIDGPPIMDGTLQRVPVDGDRGKERSGAYTGHLDGVPSGYIENFRAGSKSNWVLAEVGEKLSDDERARLHAEAAQRRQERDAKADEQHTLMIREYAALFARADPAPVEHPYFLRKDEVNTTGAIRVVPGPGDNSGPVKIAVGLADAKKLREQHPSASVLNMGDLMVPLNDATGALVGMQTISPSGMKMFAKGGRAAGAAFVIEGQGGIAVVEGWATAQSVHNATGWTVAAAMSAGNLPAIAARMRKEHPDASIVIGADDDSRSQRKSYRQRSDAAVYASQAANRTHGIVALPPFEGGEQGSDWNDYTKAHGRDAARAHLMAAAVLAERARLGATLTSEGGIVAAVIDRALSSEQQAPAQAPVLAPKTQEPERAAGAARAKKSDPAAVLNDQPPARKRAGGRKA